MKLSVKIPSTLRTWLVATIVVVSILLPFVIGLILQAEELRDAVRGVDVYVYSPSSSLQIGVPETLSILITNDGSPLNAMEAELEFDTSLFEVTNFTLRDTLCEERFVIEKSVDNETGHIHASCGTVTPFTGNIAVFGSITVIPRKDGVGAFRFGERTHIYLHDGLGTEVARDKYPKTFSISGVL